MARTAVIAGTASAVAGSVASHRAAAKHQRQAQADEQQAAAAQEAPEATAPAGLSTDSIARLQQLGDLLKQGFLTDEEFAAQKAKILGT